MAAPTKGNQQVYITGVGVTATTHTHSSYTPSAGSNRYLCVRIIHDGASTPTISSVTFGGNALTAAPNTGAAEGGVTASIYTIAEASWPATPADVVVTTSGVAGLCFLVDTIISTNGVDIDNSASNLASSTPSVSLTTTVDNCVILACFGGNDARTNSAYGPTGATEDYENANALEAGSIDVGRAAWWTLADSSTAGSKTMSATYNNNFANDAIAAIAFAPAAAAASGGIGPLVGSGKGLVG